MLLFLFLFFTCSVAQYSEYTPESYPDSQINPVLCGLPETAFVCDPSGVLKTENSSLIQLIHKLVAVQSQTKCICDQLADNSNGRCDGSGLGYIMSVAFTQRMVLNDDEKDRNTVVRAAQAFANKVRDRQPRGHCGDDLLIFISQEDKVVATSVGDATSRFLSNELITSVSTHADEFFFKKAKYYEGVSYMIDTYAQILNGEKVKIVETKHWYYPLPLWAIILIFVVVGLLLLTVLGISIYCCVKHCCCKDDRGRYTMASRDTRL